MVALLENIILASIKPSPEADVKVVVELPEASNFSIDDLEVQMLAIELMVVTKGRGFILTGKGSRRVVGIGFTDEEVARIFFQWLEAIRDYEAKFKG